MSKKISAMGAVVAGAFMAVAAQSAAADVAAGEKLYQREGCQTCHGANGVGQGSYPKLVGSAKVKDKEAFKAIVMEGKTPMPAFKGNKKVVDGIDSLHEYLSSLK